MLAARHSRSFCTSRTADTLRHNGCVWVRAYAIAAADSRQSRASDALDTFTIHLGTSFTASYPQTHVDELAALPVTTASHLSDKLLQQIAAAGDLVELKDAVGSYKEVMDHAHAAQLVGKLAQLRRKSLSGSLLANDAQQLSRAALEVITEHLERLTGDEAASVMHSLAVLQQGDRRMWTRLLQQLPLQHEQHQQQHHHLHQQQSLLSSKGLALSVYACSLAQHRPSPKWLQQHTRASTGMMPQLQAQDLSMLLWGYAGLAHRPHRAFWSSFYQASGAQLQRCGAQHLVMMLYALALLGQQPERQWWLLLTRRLVPQLLVMDSQQLPMVAWALASMRRQLPSSSCVQQLYAALLKQMPNLADQGLAMVLWALSRWHSKGLAQPSGSWQQQALQELDARAARLSASEVSTALLALARLQWSTGSALLVQLAARMQQVMPEASAEQLVNCAWALAKLSHRPGDAWLAQHTRHAQECYADMDVQQLSMMIWALSKLRYCPNLHALAALLAEVEARPLGSMSPQAVSTIMWSVAQLGTKPNKEWLDHMLLVAAKLLPSSRWGDQDLSGLVEALACLGYRPGAGWLDAFALKVDGSLARIRPQRLQAIRQALRQLGYSSDRPQGWLAGSDV